MAIHATIMFHMKHFPRTNLLTIARDLKLPSPFSVNHPHDRTPAVNSALENIHQMRG
jgi:hypothetical protein